MDDRFRQGAIMTVTKIRHQAFLDEDLSEKLETFCRRANVSKSEVTSQAVIAYIARCGEAEIDQRYSKRFDKLSGDFERLLRDFKRVRGDVEMILESLTLFIRFTIALNADKPPFDDATLALAHERYYEFVDEVGRKIARGERPFDASNKKEGA